MIELVIKNIYEELNIINGSIYEEELFLSTFFGFLIKNKKNRIIHK